MVLMIPSNHTQMFVFASSALLSVLHPIYPKLGVILMV